ncbi:hypothetical protein MMC07_003624 [Pseudocyphellaria aurata]|nr:hypothetical protein [Pseudocyphellaria aurata]
MQNLTRWEFRNLQLAGVRISVSREFQERHLLPNRCNEIIPTRLKPQCDNTTESFDVRSCKGRPRRMIKMFTIYLEERVGSTPMESCLRDDLWRLALASPNPDPEPNRDQYPIHTKICQPCRDASAEELLAEQSRMIARFNKPLCKVHSLDRRIASFPRNACRCLAFVRDSWRCRRCYEHTLSYLAYRANNKPPFHQSVPVWQRVWVYFKSFWASPPPHEPVCPMERCSRQPWLEQYSERMQICLVCHAITNIRDMGLMGGGI